MSGLTSTNDVFGRVEKHLRPWARGGQLTPDTELYRDLGMYGDDLAFDVVIWATREFGVEGSLHLTKYAPAEHSFPWLRRILRRFLGGRQAFQTRPADHNRTRSVHPLIADLR
jgi:hypothetical protein